jgi:hypothetical protein
MENEELITSLIFIEYAKLSSDTRKILEVYQKTDRLNARISDKAQISNLLLALTENGESKRNTFDSASKNIKSFIKKIKYILLDQDKMKEELFDYLKIELDDLFKAGKDPRNFRRTMQDFYFLWLLINEINFDMIKFHRLTIKKEIKDIFKYFKNIPESESNDNKGLDSFNQKLSDFKTKYKTFERKIRLTENEKLELIGLQKSVSNISGAPIFLGDDIEVDHEFPLAKGGPDEIDNLKIVQKDENREKSSKI